MTTTDLSALVEIGVRESRTDTRTDNDARPWHERALTVIETFDTLIYLLVAAAFVTSAAVMLGYAIYVVSSNVRADGMATAIVTLINDLLLVMIMMEILKTILSYLEDHAISLRPFLFIGIISATRHVLTVGATLAISEKVMTSGLLWRHLDDLLVNAAVILALAVAIRLVGTQGSNS
jgi:uncharacterized membrane protein (DUF373 family)